jgi:hypothetical protein
MVLLGMRSRSKAMSNGTGTKRSQARLATSVKHLTTDVRTSPGQLEAALDELEQNHMDWLGETVAVIANSVPSGATNEEVDAAWVSFLKDSPEEARYLTEKVNLTTAIEEAKNAPEVVPAVEATTTLEQTKNELQELEDNHSEWMRGVDAVISVRLPNRFTRKQLDAEWEKFLSTSPEEARYQTKKVVLEARINRLSRNAE